MSLELSKVLDLSRNVFIEACAGAGKTWLLSKRYAAILDEYIRQSLPSGQLIRDPSNILVITFTRKAQAEMATRIYEDLNVLLGGEALENVPTTFGQSLRAASPELKSQLRASYSNNAVLTLDSLCALIVREQARSLGVDPEFRIQDEADVQKIELESWEHYLIEKSQSRDEDLRVLLDHLSLYHLNAYVKALRSRSEFLSTWLDKFSNTSPGELEAEFKKDNPLPPNLPGIESLLDEIVTALPHEEELLKSNTYADKLMLVKEYWNSTSKDGYVHGLKLLEFVRQLCLSGSGSYYKTSPIVSTVWPEAYHAKLKQLIERLVAYASNSFTTQELYLKIPNLADIYSCTVLHHLARFYTGYRDALTQRLEYEGVLSFASIIVKAHEALQNPQIAQVYADRYDHILFDEFQDTNDLRWDIVRRIASNAEGKLRGQGVFIVGDSKQSIYRFTKADVQVMNRVRQSMQERQAHILSADITYRSSPEFVEQVINPLFTEIFNPPATSALALYEASFSPTSTPKATHNKTTGLKGPVCYYTTIEDSDSRYPEAHIYHAGKVADSWLKRLSHKDMQGPQVGILLRSFTRILDYIQIFTQMGLSFEVVSSKGLYASQEAYDLYHLLSVLVNPLDDLALVGLLRSPFFILKDAEIQDIRDQGPQYARSGWVWSGLPAVRKDVFSTIKSWRRRTAQEPLDRLLVSILDDGERQLGWISETGGRLRLANIKLLIQQVHDLGMDGLSLREIQEYFKFQIQHGDAPQAQASGTAKIQVLTIHKAKGLQFPVVILPELHARSNNDKSGISIIEGDEIAKIGIQIDELHSTLKSTTYLKLKTQVDMEEEAEDKRLFYVAVTRAIYGIECVCKVGSGGKPDTNTWWWKYINPVIEKGNYDQDQVSVRTLPASDIIHESLRPDPETMGSPAAPEELISPLRYQEISPHTIMDWLSEKDVQTSPPEASNEHEGDGVDPRKFGTLLHRVLEMEWYDLETHSDDLRAYLLELGFEDSAAVAVREELKNCLQIYLKSDVYDRLKRLSSRDKYPELPLFSFMKNQRVVYKVSGVIDLLYRSNEEWIVLDYKSDHELPASLDGHPYWYQIQTYLWMVKHLFKIEARGELYFVRHDKMIPVAPDEAKYFKILDEYELGLQPALLPRGRLPDSLRQTIERLDSDQKVYLIESTRTACDYVQQALAEAGLLRPGLMLTTLNELRTRYEPGGRRLSQHLARFGVRAVAGSDLSWGEINRLADAFLRALQGEALIDSIRGSFQRFTDWCRKNNLVMPYEYNNELKMSDDTSVLLHGFHSLVPADYEFLNHLVKRGKLAASQVPEISSWEARSVAGLPETKHTGIVCPSILDEIRYVAANIRTLLKEGVLPESIAVVVSSMERYVPVIKRVFDQNQLPLRLNKKEPVSERPIIQYVLALLRGRSMRRLDWDTAMAVWLHPVNVFAKTPESDRLNLDLTIRKYGLKYYDELKHLNVSQKQIQSALDEFKEFVEKQWCTGAGNALTEEAAWLKSVLNILENSRIIEPGSVSWKSLNALQRLVHKIDLDWNAYLKTKGSTQELAREIREQMKGLEVASAEQSWGIDVISILDAQHLENEYLFVMGLTEGQFPVKPHSNPYLKNQKINPWHVNHAQFLDWLQREEASLCLSTTLRDNKGGDLQPSTFMQGVKQKVISAQSHASIEEQLLERSSHLFDDPLVNYEQRHNAVISRPGSGEWYGQLKKSAGKDNARISATAFDDLLKCPQRYWYRRELQLESAETNLLDRQEIELGLIVHRLLEKFGLAGGFQLAKTDLPAAFEKLEETCHELIQESAPPDTPNLLDAKKSVLYLTQFKDPGKNLLSALIKMQVDCLRAYDGEQLYEQGFGMQDNPDSWPAYEISGDKLKLSIMGQIDRIFLDTHYVWASDYKTGEIDLSDLREFYTSQLLFYYLALKKHYPDKSIVLTYDQMKNFKEGKIGSKGFVGDTLTENPVLSLKPSRGNSAIDLNETGDPVTEIEAMTLNYAMPLVDNNYPLTTRDEKKACAHCEFERVCRKTSLPR